MEKKTLAKLALLANKDPAIAEALSKQASTVSDDELETVAGGDICYFVTCVFNTDCRTDTDKTYENRHCTHQTNDYACTDMARKGF